VSTFNVVKDYDWTSVPRGASLRTKAPKAVLRSYKLNTNLTLNRFKSYAEIGSKSTAEEYYNKLYSDATTEEDVFFFPYFEDSVRNINNTFEDSFQGAFGGNDGIGATADSLIQEYGGIIAEGYGILKGLDVEGAKGAYGGSGGNEHNFGAAMNALLKNSSGGSVGSYIETPKFYNYTSASEGPININFVLSNTINSDFEKNYELVRKLIEINKPKRIDAISMEPPRIYRAKIYGFRYMPWAYCSSLNITLLGTKRLIGDRIVPEAYQISMALQPLTIEVSNFMEKV